MPASLLQRLRRVICVDLTVRRPLQVFPDKPTFSEPSACPKGAKSGYHCKLLPINDRQCRPVTSALTNEHSGLDG